ncbi:MAG TPA: hypothetical protein PKC44_16840, partial [Agitococcus sp.]|nr:hypothetical protein [Agitococcus sp.]
MTASSYLGFDRKSLKQKKYFLAYSKLVTLRFLRVTSYLAYRQAFRFAERVEFKLSQYKQYLAYRQGSPCCKVLVR